MQGSLDVPLVDDVFALRFVGAYPKSDGYYKLGADYGPINTLNIFGGTFAPFTIPGVTGETGEGHPGKSAGGEDIVNGRVKAQWNADRRPDVPRAVRNHARPLGRRAGLQRHAARTAPYLWNMLGFTRPQGDPLDNMGSTQRNDSLLKMGEGQVIDVDGIYLNMEWDLGSRHDLRGGRQA